MALIALTPVTVAMYPDGLGGYRSAVPSIITPLPTNLITSSVGSLQVSAGVSKSIVGQQTVSVTNTLTTQITKQVSLTGQSITSGQGNLSYTVFDSIQLTPQAIVSNTTTPTVVTIRSPIVTVSGQTTNVNTSTPVTNVGGAVVITGTNFGTKVNAAPFFWQSFTTNNGSSNIGTIGYNNSQSVYGSNSFGSTAIVDTTAGRTSNIGALKLNMSFTAGGRDFFPHIALDTSNQGLGRLNSQQIWFSFWLKIVKTSGTDNSDYQVKGPRSGWCANTTDNYYSSSPRYVTSIYPRGAGSYRPYATYQETVTSSGAGDFVEHFSGTNPPWKTDDWNFIEVWMKFNDIGSSNGVMIQKVNGVPIVFPDTANTTAINVRSTGDESKFFSFSFLTPGIDFPGITSTSSYEAYYSEHFLDTTPQRVVLTDTANATLATKWTVQQATTWSDTNVVLTTPNYTGFTSGVTAYWQVYGVNNTVVQTQSTVVP